MEVCGGASHPTNLTATHVTISRTSVTRNPLSPPACHEGLTPPQAGVLTTGLLLHATDHPSGSSGRARRGLWGLGGLGGLGGLVARRELGEDGVEGEGVAGGGVGTAGGGRG